MPSCSNTKKADPLDAVRSHALLASRFKDLADFEKVVSIAYYGDSLLSDSLNTRHSKVILSYTSNGQQVESVLESGVSQKDILDIKKGSEWDKTLFVINTPYAVRSRIELSQIYMLARRRFHLFGEGDVAFFDLAQAAVNKIADPKLACIERRDSSEKGYINTFNHVTAQALITSLFSEEAADFLADAHERHAMPSLTTGVFSQQELTDTNNYPLDNYVDMINNEIGQELGLALKHKYKISPSTVWTPSLLSEYLNDLQSYYQWSLGIRLKPFSAEEELMERFANKINAVKGGIY